MAKGTEGGMSKEVSTGDMVIACARCKNVFEPHQTGGNDVCHPCHVANPKVYGKVGTCAMCMGNPIEPLAYMKCTNCGVPTHEGECNKQVEHLYKFGVQFSTATTFMKCRVCGGDWIVHHYAKCPTAMGSSSKAPIPSPATLPSLAKSDSNLFYPCQVRPLPDGKGMRVQYPLSGHYHESTHHISGKLHQWLTLTAKHKASVLVKSLADSEAKYIIGARWRQNGERVRFHIPGPRYNKGWGAVFELRSVFPTPGEKVKPVSPSSAKGGYICVECGLKCGPGSEGGGCWTSKGHGPLPHCGKCHIKFTKPIHAQNLGYSSSHPCPQCKELIEEKNYACDKHEFTTTGMCKSCHTSYAHGAPK